MSKTFENLSLNEKLVAALAVSPDESAATLLPASKRLVARNGVSFWEYLTDRVSGKNLIPALGVLIAEKALQSRGMLASSISGSPA